MAKFFHEIQSGGTHERKYIYKAWGKQSRSKKAQEKKNDYYATEPIAGHLLLEVGARIK